MQNAAKFRYNFRLALFAQAYLPNYVPPPKVKGEGGHIGFSADPVGVGVGMTESCIQDISSLKRIQPNLPEYIIGTSFRAVVQL